MLLDWLVSQLNRIYCIYEHNNYYGAEASFSFREFPAFLTVFFLFEKRRNVTNVADILLRSVIKHNYILHTCRGWVQNTVQCFVTPFLPSACPTFPSPSNLAFGHELRKPFLVLPPPSNKNSRKCCHVKTTISKNSRRTVTQSYENHMAGRNPAVFPR